MCYRGLGIRHKLSSASLTASSMADLKRARPSKPLEQFHQLDLLVNEDQSGLDFEGDTQETAAIEGEDIQDDVVHDYSTEDESNDEDEDEDNDNDNDDLYATF